MDTQYQQLFNEIEKIKNNITEKDSEILHYLLMTQLWEFYNRNIDEEYRYPYT
jgi:nuclear transport factor 2 (NTF2) superfamily protein